MSASVQLSIMYDDYTVITDSVVSICVCIHYGEDMVHRHGHKKFIIFLRMYGDLYRNLIQCISFS